MNTTNNLLQSEIPKWVNYFKHTLEVQRKTLYVQKPDWRSPSFDELMGMEHNPMMEMFMKAYGGWTAKRDFSSVNINMGTNWGFIRFKSPEQKATFFSKMSEIKKQRLIEGGFLFFCPLTSK